MFTFLIILITLIAILLVLVVLLQSGRGGGLAGIAAGGAQQVLGARQAPDILEKTTWTLAVLFIVLCILTNFTIDTTERRESIIQQRAQQERVQPTLPPAEQPAVPPAEAPAPSGNQQNEQN
ncbi:preprotein translocase subunit SecG [Rhodothermus profundi]|uniref:Protein-export membrane protein SecG n=1 Tax=Rhodothermus profundi TaxID=633813 RepID=A0A1M6P3M7_9BACT|nr:preprotein translocase subunit SecG [Rhodothermus profundi]SHK02528.1 protein translocase subunit secG [Rhodothermus profundi]